MHCLLADTAPLAPDPVGAQIKSLGYLVLMVVVMWVVLFMPQRKKTKELEALVKSLKPGDKIVTSSGIIAVVLSVKDRTVSIRSADTKLEVLKSSVTEVTERSGESSEAKS